MSEWVRGWGTEVWTALMAAAAAIAGVIGKRVGSRTDNATSLSASAMEQVASMRIDLNTERERGDRLEQAVGQLLNENQAIRVEQHTERTWCTTRIAQLVDSMRRQGLDVPPPPDRPDPPPGL